MCWVLEDGARRPPSYLKILFCIAGGRGAFKGKVKSEESMWLAWLTIVGRWPLCPVLPTLGMGYLFRNAGCWRTGRGDHRPTIRLIYTINFEPRYNIIFFCLHSRVRHRWRCRTRRIWVCRILRRIASRWRGRRGCTGAEG